MNKNTLYLCGAEDIDVIAIVLWKHIEEPCNFVELISAPSRGVARDIVADEIDYGEFTSRMTIRKVGMTDEPTGIVHDHYGELWALAWEQVPELQIPTR